MKNIHVLPTDKPSRLQLNVNTKRLILFNNIQSNNESAHLATQNILITSDEEIKEENLTKEIYVIDIQTNNIGKLTCKNRFFKGSSKLIEVEWKNKQNIWNYYQIREIILTTDQELIKDGVQSIDDDFLEWFVKNPSCEEIETKLVEQRSHLTLNDWVDEDENGKFPISIAGAFCYRKIYKIIIPKEEIRDINAHTGFDEEGHSLNYQGDILPLVKKEPKQETIEDIAKWVIEFRITKNEYARVSDFEMYHTIIEKVSKWQQEISYSEEEVNSIFYAICKHSFFEDNVETVYIQDVKDEFEQFKK